MLSDLQKKLDQGFEVAKVQIWLTKPHERLNDKEVEKVGCKSVRDYIAMLEAEGLRSMGSKVKSGYNDLELCTVGTIKDGVKTLIASYQSLSDIGDVDFSYE